jgi:beta-galactosidase
MTKSIQLDTLQLGVCYYPEHWPEAMWEDDYRRMKELGFSVVRLAEFAWSIFEPEEGVFSFELFDRAIVLAEKHGLKVILGTPTATPPAWLTHKYPEVLNVSQDGVVFPHGARRHYNYSSTKYRELCASIVERMAAHYGDHPTVIGWQIDNELNCETNVFYAEADHRAFREWLQVKYGTLEGLNHAWGAVFWNQTYSGWEQVHLTRPTVSNGLNPHQALDEKRFISDNAISFAKEQADILRKHARNQWVTTNGLFGHLDSHALTDEMLDFFSYDSYPQFSTIFPVEEEEPLRDRISSFNLSQIRSISPNFCIMEQQSGPGGWVTRMEMPSPRPGQMRLWTYQSIMHGTDLLLYFRWRTAAVGTEIYWHGINDHHNRPNRRVREAEQIGKEIAAIGGRIAGTRYQAAVAIVRDYDNQWDGELDRWHGPLEWKSVRAWFKQLQYRHVPADVLYMRSGTTLEQLSAYKVLIYPHAAIMTEETAQLLTAYVEQGGKVIFGARTGYKTIDGHCRMEPLPGPVARLCGVTVEDYTIITGTATPATLTWSRATEETPMKAEAFNEILQVEDPSVETIASYSSEYYAGTPALTRRKAGTGEAWYYGAAFSDRVVEEIIRRLALVSPSEEWAALPRQVELGIRSGEDADYAFLLNYDASPANVTLKQGMKELMSGEKLEGPVTIPPYGVLILEKLK